MVFKFSVKLSGISFDNMIENTIELFIIWPSGVTDMIDENRSMEEGIAELLKDFEEKTGMTFEEYKALKYGKGNEKGE